MTIFYYGTAESLSFPKTDETPIGSDDPTKFVQASEWNDLCQAVTDGQTLSLVQALAVSGGLVAWDGSTKLKAKVTLTTAATISAMTNALVGATYFLAITGYAGNALLWDASYDFGAESPPTTPVAGKVMLVQMDCTAGGGAPHLRCWVIDKGFSS